MKDTLSFNGRVDSSPFQEGLKQSEIKIWRFFYRPLSQIKLQQLRCIPWGSNQNKVAHEILTESICTVADWCRPLFAKAHMEVSFCCAHQPIFFKFVEPGCFSICYCILSTFHVLKFDNGAKSYLGGWSSDVLLCLFTSYLFILSFIFLGVRP